MNESLIAEYNRQIDAGLHPDAEKITPTPAQPVAPQPTPDANRVSDNTASGVGLPADYLLASQADGMRGTVCDLNGTPSRLTTASDLGKLTVNYNGLVMRCSDAIAHGLAVRHADGRIQFADELDAQVAKPAATTSPNQTTPKADEVTPEAQAQAAEVAELGVEVAAASQAWSEVGLDAGMVGIAVARQDEATMERAMSALVRGGLAANSLEAYEWINGLVADGEAKLTAKLEEGGLDAARVLQALREDRSLQGDLERGAAIFANTGSIDGFGAALTKLADSGKLNSMFKEVQK